MSDKENVQPEAVLPEGKDVLPEVKPEVKPEGEPKEQPFNEEQEARIQQMVAQATDEATKQAVEAGRRQLQSEQDRNINTEKRARFAESKANAYETSFKGLDEETQKDIELARYREQDKYFQSTAQEDAQKQQDADFWGRINTQVLTNLDNLGIPRDDKRLDWGEGSRDLPEARARLDASVAKIISEEKKVAETDMEKRLTAKIEEQNLRNRKELNLDLVDTTAGGGSGDDSDAEFKRAWGSGELPNTQVNMKRARKLETA
ncbi:hypothetical protein LCGC14_0406030 [marine sediment metagenome]|uniref:Uncharacterized protein n=1 Tax=marine sediment metagenome TaxID=412755 RepID=A0A0F9T0X4_9ZZZZ